MQRVPGLLCLCQRPEPPLPHTLGRETLSGITNTLSEVLFSSVFPALKGFTPAVTMLFNDSRALETRGTLSSRGVGIKLNLKVYMALGFS